MDRGQAHALRGRPRGAPTGVGDLLGRHGRPWDEICGNAVPSARDGPVIDGSKLERRCEDQAPEALSA